MAINVSDGFEITNNAPLDAKLIQADLTARDAIVSYQRYIGMEVYVISESKKYRLVGGITNSDWIDLSSIVNLDTGSLVTTASFSGWASSSVVLFYGTSSFATSASYAPSLWLVTGSTYPITASWSVTSSFATSASRAVSSSYALSASYAPYVDTMVTTGSLYPITASWALTASYISGSIDFSTTEVYSLTASAASVAVSASWASTASYFNQLWLSTGSLYPITSSWAITSSNAVSSSYLKGEMDGTSFRATGSIFNYQTTTYTLLGSDNGRMVSISSNTDISLVVSNSLDPTFNCMVYQSGSGIISFVTESGINLRNRSSYVNTAGQYAVATLLRVSPTDFILAGDLG